MAQIRPMQRDDYRKKVIPTTKVLKKACEELRFVVEHPNKEGKILLRTGVTVDRDPKLVMTTKIDGIEVGYRVVPSSPLEINHFFDRDVFLKIPGYKISELNQHERTSFLTTLFEVFLEPQQGLPDITPIADDAVKISQRFQVAFPVRIGHATIQVPRGLMI
jgi:hypothetical protein